MPSFTIGKPPPILDFSAFYADDSHGKAKLVEQVRDCCLHNGFFQVTGHGLPLDLQKRALSCGRRFFLLPMEEKLKLDKSKLWRLLIYTVFGPESQLEAQANAQVKRTEQVRPGLRGSPLLSGRTWNRPGLEGGFFHWA